MNELSGRLWQVGPDLASQFVHMGSVERWSTTKEVVEQNTETVNVSGRIGACMCQFDLFRGKMRDIGSDLRSGTLNASKNCLTRLINRNTVDRYVCQLGSRAAVLADLFCHARDERRACKPIPTKAIAVVMKRTHLRFFARGFHGWPNILI